MCHSFWENARLSILGHMYVYVKWNCCVLSRMAHALQQLHAIQCRVQWWGYHSLCNLLLMIHRFSSSESKFSCYVISSMPTIKPLVYSKKTENKSLAWKHIAWDVHEIPFNGKFFWIDFSPLHNHQKEQHFVRLKIQATAVPNARDEFSE